MTSASAPQAVGFLVSSAFRQMRQVFARRLQSLAITPPQAAVLMMLHRLPHASLSEVARQARGDTPTLCRIIDRLERRGLARRQQNAVDRRCLVIKLTERGLKLALASQSIAEELERALLAGFTPRERLALQRLLGRTLENAVVLNRTPEHVEEAP